MDPTVSAIFLWTAAFAGIVAVVLAIRVPRLRRTLLILAAVLFLPIGVLGILSIGAIFLVAALVCLVVAVLSRRVARPPSSPAGS